MTEEPLNVEILQLPIKQKKPFNPFNLEIDLRREDLLMLVNALTIGGARKQSKTLAEKYKVSRQTIYNDFTWIVGHYKPANLREIKIDLRIARDRALQSAMELLAYAMDPEQKLRGIGAVIAAARHYREELEAWGEKEKMPDKHELSGNVPVIINLIEKSVEEIKSEKRTQPADNPQASGTSESTK
jgi:hypothetical protein